jgi:hypothetical protein
LGQIQVVLLEIFGETMGKKFFTRHAKSSAALVSLGIHAVVILVAVSFVAVTVITKEDQVFEAKKVKRPKMQLKKLQVPVNIKKKKMQKPKLRKRLVVQPKLAKVPDIKMPEITGVKGGMGNAAGAGLGGAGSLGFNMPEMSLFGVKSRGEKVFIILDSSGYMMVDKMGGIPAYTIIKSELVRILEGLNPAVLFNIAIYERNASYTLYPSLVSASASNVAKVEEWLKPLNAVSKGMGDRDYGTKTMGAGGIRSNSKVVAEPLKNSPGEWSRPALQAMEQGADVVFLLSCRWGTLRYQVAKNDKDRKWSEDDQKRYLENIAKARELHEKENERRRAKGEPPRVVTRGDRGLVMAYIKNAKLPPGGGHSWHNYTPDELVEAFQNLQRKARSGQGIPAQSGIGKKKKKDRFTFNVIHFVPEDAGPDKDAKFSKMAGLTRGEYSRVKGMAAIQSYVSASEGEEMADVE